MGTWRSYSTKKTNKLWFPVKLLRQENKSDFEEAPLHSGTALAWICPCRWEPRGCRPGSGPGAGGGTGGSTSHWGTGWSPPRGAGRGARTPPSGTPQGPVHQPLLAPRQILTYRILKRFNPQQKTQIRVCVCVWQQSHLSADSPGRSMATARHPALARVSRVPMLSQFSEEKRMPWRSKTEVLASPEAGWLCL